ncbi:MAG: cell division protein ZapA [Pseudomonadota bacterium]
MPEVNVTIGGRDFEVACQEGEEHFLQSAAQLLDAEASTLVNQIGRMPEGRMLLMAGLMLADKSAGMDEQLRLLEEQVQQQETVIASMRDAPAPEPEKVEVPVIPADVTDSLAELAARAEALAATAEEKASA